MRLRKSDATLQIKISMFVNLFEIQASSLEAIELLGINLVYIFQDTFDIFLEMSVLYVFKAFRNLISRRENKF